MHSLQLLVVLYTPIRVCFLAEKWEFLWFYFNSDPKSILLFFLFLIIIDLIWFVQIYLQILYLHNAHKKMLLSPS